MPIEVEPNGIPVHISKDLKTIFQAEPTTARQIIIEDIYFLPVGSPIERWVNPHGFRREAGGTITSILISEDDTPFTIPLVLPDNKDLPQGTNGITIDGVLYKAVSPPEIES